MSNARVITPDTMCKKSREWQPLVNVMSVAGQQKERSGKLFLQVRGEIAEEKGPYTFDQVRSMWNQGIVTADAVFRFVECWEPLHLVVPDSEYSASAATGRISSPRETESPSPLAAVLRPPTLAKPICDSIPADSTIQGLDRQIKTNFRSVLWWVLFLLCLVAVASVASKTGNFQNAGIFSFLEPILGILVLRGWCRRRTLKILRKNSWVTEKYFSRVYFVGLWGYLWRSFLVFSVIGVALAMFCSESPTATQAFSATGIVFWFLCAPFTLDVPYWIKRKLDGVRDPSEVAAVYQPQRLQVKTDPEVDRGVVASRAQFGGPLNHGEAAHEVDDNARKKPDNNRA